jgi:hypothetical protein
LHHDDETPFFFGVYLAETAASAFASVIVEFPEAIADPAPHIMVMINRLRPL